MLAFLVDASVLITVLCACEIVLTHCPRTSARLDRFIAGHDPMPVEAIPAHEWARKHGYTDEHADTPPCKCPAFWLRNHPEGEHIPACR